MEFVPKVLHAILLYYITFTLLNGFELKFEEQNAHNMLNNFDQNIKYVTVTTTKG